MSQSDVDDSDPLLEFSSERGAAVQVNSPTETAVQPVAAPVDPRPAPPPAIPIETLVLRIELLESALESSKAQVSTLKDEVATLVRAIGDIKNNLSDLKNTVGVVNSTVSDLTNTVGGVKNTVGDLTNTVGGVKNTVADLKNTVGAVNNTVGDLKNTVSVVKNTVGDVKNSVGNLKRQAARAAVIRTAISLPRAARAPKTASVVLAALVGLGAGVFGWMYFAGAADARVGGVTVPAQATASQETAFAPADQPAVPPEPAAAPPTSRSTAVVPVPVAPRARAPAPAPAPVSNTHANYVGSLSIDSQPDGEVFLNRQSAGHTPLRLTNLRAGSHLIWVERDGYRRWTRVVQVPADRVTRLFADLEPISAR